MDYQFHTRASVACRRSHKLISPLTIELHLDSTSNSEQIQVNDGGKPSYSCLIPSRDETASLFIGLVAGHDTVTLTCAICLAG